jgi:predicted dienelactone hydrolase
MADADSEYGAGHRSLRIHDDERDRPILLDIWYPSDAVEAARPYLLGSGSAAEDAEIHVENAPAILLSHGAFGSAQDYGWLAEHLARNGNVVVGVSHFGESLLYGGDTINPAAVLDPGSRPRDCSVALDFVLREPPFRGTVDAERVGALGHSSGGTTAVELVGGCFDPQAMGEYCASDVEQRDRGCDYARSGAVPSSAGGRAASHRDERVCAIVALDPALGPGYSAGSLAAVSVPVHIIGSVDNDFLPFDAHANHFAQHIPGASLTRLNGGEGHFVYLNSCSFDIDANGVPLCRDRAGVDRDEVHERLKPIIAEFFEQQLNKTR